MGSISLKNLSITAGTPLFRNHDHEFERALEKKSAERRIRVDARFHATAAGYALSFTDEDGVTASAGISGAFEAAQHADHARATIREQLGKLGNTLFAPGEIVLELDTVPFLPAALPPSS